MNDRIKKIIKPMIIIAIILFVLFLVLLKPTSIDDYCSCAGYSISLVTILFVLYERLIWRIIPWNRPPRLKKKYSGTLSYVYKSQPGTKPIDISVKQSWLTVSIKAKTDINSSLSITGMIVSEYGNDVLYYNYITNPDAVTQGKNPIQYGTCRMMLDSNNETIKGKYC